MVKGGWVYIITNKYNTVLYTGVTSDLLSRVYQHKNNYYPKSFSSRYKCCKIVWYEYYIAIEEAIEVEKRIKKWRRAWKMELIKRQNENFIDLWDNIQNQ
jgi:putative endonuclease